jgi:hypothetical protein
VRRAAALAAVLAAAALGGCGGCGAGAHNVATTPGGGPPQPSNALGDEAVVRLWSEALYEGHYGRAASFFAPRAIVQQFGTRVLRNHADAVAFNRSLTCRAKVLRLRHEKEGVLLATFNLGPGPGGGCTGGGTVRVRFGVHNGLITAWRQLPEPPAAPSQTT